MRGAQVREVAVQCELLNPIKATDFDRVNKGMQHYNSAEADSSLF
jgi:hypothetical protein